MKRSLPAKFESAVILSLFLSVFTPIVGSIFFRFFLSDLKLKLIDMHLHSVIEALGSFTALSLAGLILAMQKDRRGKMYSYHLFVSCALISIGVLDLLHSISPLGDSFVWLRSTAGLMGGLLFALVWLPDRFVQQRLAYILLTAVSIISVTSVVFPVAFPGLLLPTMAVEGAFTTSAKAINFLGGLLFLVAAAFFLTRYRRSGRSNMDLVFFNFCMLNGWAGLLFPFSDMWSDGWWFWHLIRLTAYGITIAYISIVIKSEAKELIHINEDLQAEVFERKHAEAELRKSEERFRQISESTGEWIWEVDTNGLYTYAGPAVEKILGYKPDDIVGKKHFYDLFAPDIREQLKAAAFEAFTKKESFRRFINPNVHKNGKDIIILETSGLPILDEHGNLLGYRGADNDITDRRRFEEALRESEERYRKLVEFSPDAIAVHSEGKVVFVNAAATKLFAAADPEQLIGRSIMDFVHPDYRRLVKERVRQMSEEGKGVTLTDEKFVKLDGSFMDVEVKARPFTYQGKPGIQVIIHDITDRKRAEEALKQSEEKYRTLVDNMQDGVFIIQDLKILFVNEASAKMAGYTAEEVLGRNVIEFVAPEYRDAVMDRYRRRQAGEDVPREYECCLLHKDGKTRILVNVNVSRVQYQGREASMITMKDITEKKKLEAQLLQAQRLESIGTLAGGIAHDINNVLSPITMSLYLLKEKLIDSESKELLGLLEKSTQRASDLVKQVQSFTRGEGNRASLQVSHLISEMRQIAKETFPRNIEVRTNVPEDLWATSGDATQLHQVLMNLCINARDAIPSEGILSISAENIFIDKSFARMHIEAKIGPYIVVTVSDTGTGIPPEIMDRIFDPFFTTKQPGKGTGLGLSTALGIVKSHGGFMNVYSEVGKGSAFKVYLPATVQAAEAQEIEEQIELPTGHGELVLVVDDEVMICRITSSVLETNGYRVLTAKDGPEAIPLYEQNKEEIRAVIMDMMLPVMDGLTCINALKKVNPDVKVIAVSGLAENGDVVKTKGDTTAPVQAFLTKPYTSDILLKTVHEVIEAKTREDKKKLA